jgi:hypothetical protein
VKVATFKAGHGGITAGFIKQAFQGFKHGEVCDG